MVSDTGRGHYFLPVWMSGAMKTVRRPRLRMPPDVRDVLVQKGLLAAYRARPPYQRNDYVGWIERAKMPNTRRKRIELMLDELAAGHGYMTMHWEPPRRRRKIDAP
jgi:uncharacterized protein YdeI (YjbR/CyaY-like superfamily)